MQSTSIKLLTPWLALVSRSVLFFGCQCLLALGMVLGGQAVAWDEAARWWVFSATLTNLVTIYLLIRLYRAEGERYLTLLRFIYSNFKKDILWFLAAMLVGLPIATVPMNPLAAALFGDPVIPVAMMFRPLPVWALVVGLLFPLTIAFAELPLYFGCNAASGCTTQKWMVGLGAGGPVPSRTARFSAVYPRWALLTLAGGNVSAVCLVCRVGNQAAPKLAALFLSLACHDGCFYAGGLSDVLG